MSFFQVEGYDAAQATEEDRTGGGRKLLESGIYDAVIKHAYFQKSSKSDALSLNLEFAIGEQKLREQIWFTNGKGGVKYPDKKDNNVMKFLPGFITADTLTWLATEGKTLEQVQKSVQKKTINLYNFQERKELPTDVDMVMDLVGKPIKLGVLHSKVNKQQKNDSNQYEDINEALELNQVDKYFHAKTGKSRSEIQAKGEAKFIKTWEAQWAGKLNDRFKAVAGTGNAGMPTGGFAGAAEPAGTTADDGAANPFM